jgi:probable HAF family extracellular repeat protein
MHARSAMCLAALAPLAAAAAWAQFDYEAVVITPLPSNGLTEVYLWDINESNLAVGTSTSGPFYSAYLWTDASDKTAIPLTWPKGLNNVGTVVENGQVYDIATGASLFFSGIPGSFPVPRAQDVNDNGIVVGFSECACSNSDGLLQFAMIWDATGGTRGIDVLGAKELLRINNSNVAVGNIRGPNQAFVYFVDTGEVINLQSLLGAGVSSAYDISETGIVTGEGWNGSAQAGFIWSQEAGFTFMPALGGGLTTDVHPKGVSSDGTAVGYALAAGGDWKAFIWSPDAGMRDLNTLAEGLPANFELDRALMINDNGWIIGDGHYGPSWGLPYAFVLKPIEAQSCYADCNDDGSVNIFDFLCFQGLVTTADPAADCNADGSVNIFDFLCFQGHVTQGCT